MKHLIPYAGYDGPAPTKKIEAAPKPPAKPGPKPAPKLELLPEPIVKGHAFWGRLIYELRREHHVSERSLAVKAKVNRSTLRRIQSGQGGYNIDILDRLLSVLGYELEAVSALSKQQRLQRLQADESDPDKRSKLAAARLLEMKL